MPKNRNTEKRLKIGIVRLTTKESLKQEVGRAEIALKSLVKVCSAFSKEIHIFEKVNYLFPDGRDTIKIYPLKRKDWHNFFLNFFTLLIFQIKVVITLFRKGRGLDFCFIGWGEYTLLLPLLALKLMKAKSIVIAVGSSMRQDYFLKGHKSPLLMYLCGKIELLTALLADTIMVYTPAILESEEVSAWIKQIPRSKIRIACFNYINSEQFKYEVPFNQRKNTLAFIGKLSEDKGAIALTEALPSILAHRELDSVYIIGNGVHEEKVKSLVTAIGSKKVRMLGWVPHSEVAKYLNESKLWILPSMSEGLPKGVLEAMACGTIVLATPVGGIPSLIKDGKTGFILEDNSPECITRNVVRVLNHPDLDEIAKNAHALVEKEYSYEAVVERYKSILTNLA